MRVTGDTVARRVQGGRPEPDGRPDLPEAAGPGPQGVAADPLGAGPQPVPEPRDVPKTDVAFTNTMATARSVLGNRCVIENHSMKATANGADNEKLFTKMTALGRPMAMQTNRPDVLGDLGVVLRRCVGMGAEAIELPWTYRPMGPPRSSPPTATSWPPSTRRRCPSRRRGARVSGADGRTLGARRPGARAPPAPGSARRRHLRPAAQVSWRSAHGLGIRRTSRGKIAHPVGTSMRSDEGVRSRSWRARSTGGTPTRSSPSPSRS